MVEVEICIMKPMGYSAVYLVKGTTDRLKAATSALEDFEKRWPGDLKFLNYVTAKPGSAEKAGEKVIQLDVAEGPSPNTPEADATAIHIMVLKEQVQLLHDATIVLRNGMGGHCPICTRQREARRAAARLIEQAGIEQ